MLRCASHHCANRDFIGWMGISIGYIYIYTYVYNIYIYMYILFCIDILQDLDLLFVTDCRYFRNGTSISSRESMIKGLFLLGHKLS
jgi:hypothetical protein